MKLVPREAEKLALHGAGFLAQKRLARGLRLNYTEAIALIASQILEFVRDGDKTVTDLMDLGKQMLGRRQVLPAVPYLLDTVQVEGTFMDGTKLITVHDPISSDDGNLELALHGSYLPVPSLEKFSGSDVEDYPGEVHFCSGRIILNLHRRALTLKVVNKADRPIQIGSHYHFIEANPYLVFDRLRAYGMRLNIPAGTAVRFEPGDAKRVTLVSIGGRKVIRGGNGIADGAVDSSQLNEVIQKITENCFGHEDYPDASEGLIGDGIFDCSVDHEKYSSMYGPTTGDKIRLGDTDLFAEIEKDFAVYGDECIFGGGKVLRDGMGQSAGYPASASLDTVITNAVVIDYTGIYKADIGIKDGLIIAIGKAGNPDVMDGVHSNMIVGVNTEVIAAQGMIVTAGGIDCHVHFICPQLINEAIASGITTLVGGGTGPAHGTCATTCTPAPSQMKLMLQSTDEFPINVGFTGKGNTAKPEGLSEIIKAGAMGLKLHEDWGSTPAAIDNCLSVAEAFDIQVNIHTDTLNEAGCVEHTIAAFKDRSIHTYHSEGAGGGHAPDIIKVCGVKNVLPSSTNPTRPFTSNTVDEHLDMLMVCHHLDKNIPEDVAFAESRIRAETIAAEDILHDMGAISIISSDSQAMGRIGEVIIRTWQTANKMKVQRGWLPGPGESDPAKYNDNFRIRRYIAKYTINPAIVSGFSDFVGSVEAGKLADLVLWKPAFFGAKPELIIKGGAIAWANMGDPNASIPTPEPVMMRPMFGAYGKAGSSHSIAFVSKAAKEAGVASEYKLAKRVEAVGGVRSLTKLDMKLNDALPKIEVDPETYTVTADGEVLTCQPAATVPLSRNSPLMSLVRSKIMELGAATDELLEIIKPLCIIIYTLVTVCGYKSVIKFFPHQVSDLELAVALLEKCHTMSSATALRQESTGEMETKCVVLLWLYILILIPFDISSVDTSIAATADVPGSEVVPLVTRILDICKDYLSNSGPMRRMSGLLLARLLTRPDMLKAFSSFMEWAHKILLSVTDDFVDQFRSIGIVEALASIFKIGNRRVLHDANSGIWNDCSFVMKTNIAIRSPLLRKFLVKLAQRVALISLAPRTPSWRYQSVSSSLGANLVSSAAVSSSGSTQQVNVDQTDTCGLEEDMDVPEIVEEIIDLLLTGLRDSDTIVRWSAAKGVGRITARLTPALSEEVLSSILQLFSPGEGDGSWHGGCLALAELARRGLLLPSSFPDVIPVIMKALHYDVRRGPHSIGSHVRDAAAYVCWAFGRAYTNIDMKAVLEQLAPHLLTVACYDREVNCRRAASAAFQENVGRQGTYPHGIDIVNTTDYFALASRSNSYLSVAVSVAQYKEYVYPFAEELLCNKITHWERSLRELAAQALALLVQYDMDYFSGHALKKLIPCTLSSDLCTRHGATLAAGEIALKLHQLGFIFTTDMQRGLSGIVPAIEKARLYRGKGGEIMRSAVSRFIACISIAAISLNEKTKRSLVETLNENLRHPNSQIQCAAVDALKHFIPTYLVSAGEKIAHDVISKYVTLLDDPNVAARRGGALALGILPYEFLLLKWRPVMSKLCSSCTIEDKADDPDAEARMNSVRGLILVCETLTSNVDQSSDIGESVYAYIKVEVMPALFRALDDYAVDNRGDVGSWVREAAMDALERCTFILCKRDAVAVRAAPAAEDESEPSDMDANAISITYQLFDSAIAQDLVAGIAKQAVEKIDKIREIAVRALQRILYNQEQFVPSIPYRKLLEEIIPNNSDLEWAVPTVSYPRLVKILQASCYSKPVLSGLVISTGGLQESLRKASTSALVGYLQDSSINIDDEGKSREYLLSRDILWVLQRYQKCDRVITPTLKTIETLLSKQVFLNKEGHGDFYSELINLLGPELKGSKDFTKLCAGLSILGYISSQLDGTGTKAFSQLLVFLGHRYPKIRKAAADQVYLVLLQNDSLISAEDMDKAQEVLAETCWEGDVEEARHKRSELNVMAGFGVAASDKSENRQGARAPDVRNAASTDENTSYSSLVEFSGY